MSEKLVVLKGLSPGKEYPLAGNQVFIGAASDCEICLTDDGVLARHAILDKRDDEWHLRSADTAKLSDTEGQPIVKLRIQHGTTFSLGTVTLRFVSSPAIIDGAGEWSSPGVMNQEDAVRQLKSARDAIMREISRIIVGQQAVLNQILVALFARGHCLLIGVPGLAKTMMVRVLAGTLDLNMRRIQFTPDLMPTDITGTDILEEDPVTRNRRFRFSRGPLFTNLLLADEINRTPPKTQAALLEAMQERHVTAAGITYPLPQPFMVMATQNPIEQEGTYPLPEAQLDRFMFCVKVDYPEADDEKKIIMETTRDTRMEVGRVLNAQTILQLQHIVRRVPVSEHIASYVIELVRATRPTNEGAPDFIKRWVQWGAGPRAGQFLLLAAKAHVLLEGRLSVSCADVREYALPVMRHRIFCNFAAASERVTTDDIINKVIAAVKEPSY